MTDTKYPTLALAGTALEDARTLPNQKMASERDQSLYAPYSLL